MNTKKLTFHCIFSFLLISSTHFLLKPEKSLAHVACKVSVPWGWEEACPHPHLPEPSSDEGESCLAVMSYPKEYQWSIKNTKSYAQTFWMDKKEYKLEAEESKFFNSKVGWSSTSSCGGTYYPKPIVSFDRYVDDGKFTEHKITVEVTKYTSFIFWKDGNTIKFSEE
jgi:hypothetical protein